MWCARPRSACSQPERPEVDLQLSPEDAIIPPEKLRDYVLNESHRDGRSKAVYLRGLGYERDHWQRLAADLRTQHLPIQAQPARPSPYGAKYEILGPLTGPNGATGWIRTIWIVLVGETAPRLVTLIPEEQP